MEKERKYVNLEALEDLDAKEFIWAHDPKKLGKDFNEFSVTEWSNDTKLVKIDNIQNKYLLNNEYNTLVKIRDVFVDDIMKRKGIYLICSFEEDLKDLLLFESDDFRESLSLDESGIIEENFPSKLDYSYQCLKAITPKQPYNDPLFGYSRYVNLDLRYMNLDIIVDLDTLTLRDIKNIESLVSLNFYLEGYWEGSNSEHKYDLIYSVDTGFNPTPYILRILDLSKTGYEGGKYTIQRSYEYWNGRYQEDNEYQSDKLFYLAKNNFTCFNKTHLGGLIQPCNASYLYDDKQDRMMIMTKYDSFYDFSSRILEQLNTDENILLYSSHDKMEKHKSNHDSRFRVIVSAIIDQIENGKGRFKNVRYNQDAIDKYHILYAKQLNDETVDFSRYSELIRRYSELIHEILPDYKYVSTSRGFMIIKLNLKQTVVSRYLNLLDLYFLCKEHMPAREADISSFFAIEVDPHSYKVDPVEDEYGYRIYRISCNNLSTLGIDDMLNKEVKHMEGIESNFRNIISMPEINI